MMPSPSVSSSGSGGKLQTPPWAQAASLQEKFPCVPQSGECSDQNNQSFSYSVSRPFVYLFFVEFVPPVVALVEPPPVGANNRHSELAIVLSLS